MQFAIDIAKDVAFEPQYEFFVKIKDFVNAGNACVKHKNLGMLERLEKLADTPEQSQAVEIARASMLQRK